MLGQCIVKQGMSSAWLIPQMFSSEICSEWISQLREQVHFPPRPIILYGPNVVEPRDVIFYGEPGSSSLAYGPLNRQPLPFPPVLHAVLRHANNFDVSKLVGREPAARHLNVALVSCFKNGRDSIGWHSDHMLPLGKDPYIFSLNLGGTRMFGFKHNQTKKQKWVQLKNGSVVIMLGRELQLNYEHSVPKDESVMERWNLSLRFHVKEQVVQDMQQYQKKNRESISDEGVLKKYL